MPDEPKISSDTRTPIREYSSSKSNSRYCSRTLQRMPYASPLFTDDIRNRPNVSSGRLSVLIPRHQLEKSDRVAHRVDFAFLLAVNRAHRHGRNAKTFLRRDEQHLGFVVEIARLAK